MKITNIYLVRHGESVQNVGKNFELRLPDHAVYLTNKGISQAQQAGKFFKDYMKTMGLSLENFDMLVSPFERTRQTAENFNKFVGIANVKEEDLLVEMNFGYGDLLEKRTLSALFPHNLHLFNEARRYNGRFFARRVGGESPFDCLVRQELLINKLTNKINSGAIKDNIVLVGHGAQISCFRKAMFNYSHEWYETEPNPGNCSIQHIQIRDGIPVDCGYIHGQDIGRL